MATIPSKKNLKRRKVSKETKEVLTSITTDLSVIAHRKTSQQPLPFDNLSAAMKTMEIKIAALTAALPEVADFWVESHAKEALQKILRRRKQTINLLITLFIFLSALLLGGSIAVVMLVTHWAKYVLLLVGVLVLVILSSNFKKIILQPVLQRQDKNLPTKFSQECQTLNTFIDFLVELRRKI